MVPAVEVSTECEALLLVVTDDFFKHYYYQGIQNHARARMKALPEDAESRPTLAPSGQSYDTKTSIVAQGRSHLLRKTDWDRTKPSNTSTTSGTAHVEADYRAQSALPLDQRTVWRREARRRGLLRNHFEQFEDLQEFGAQVRDSLHPLQNKSFFQNFPPTRSQSV
jgi:hypothetical protein